MLRVQLHLLAVTGCTDVTDHQPNACRFSPVSNSLSYSCSSSRDFSSCDRLVFSLSRRRRRLGGRSESILISCSSIFNGQSADNVHDRDDDYVEAVVLISETLEHHHMRTHGYQEKKKWQSPGQLYPFSGQRKDPRGDINAIGPGFLRRYPNPTIFLKISCDADYLLPIIVGEFAVEKLINSSKEDERGDCPNAFQLTRNIVQRLGYKVKMVRITERVDNIYFARIYFNKPGKKDILRVDARPSDAINVAERCRAPIYVNKQIVLTDAVRISYGMSRLHDTKSIYDVSLDRYNLSFSKIPIIYALSLSPTDTHTVIFPCFSVSLNHTLSSAIDGPDLLAEELDMVKNMNLAIKEERYGDAAMWRDRLVNIREPRYNH